MPPGKYLF